VEPGFDAPSQMQQQQQEQEQVQQQTQRDSGSGGRFSANATGGGGRLMLRVHYGDWARVHFGMDTIARRRSIPELVDPLPEEATAQLRCLRCPSALNVLLSVAMVGVQFWCMCDAMHLLWREDFGQKCQLLRFWLISYCIAVALLPCCAGLSLPLLACCIMMGKLIRARSLDNCQQRAAGSCSFADVVIDRTLVSLTLLPISFGLSCLVHRRLQAIRNRWGQQGPALEEIINHIVASPAPEVPCGTECAICLSDDTTLLADWRELRCGHKFHLECLRSWLERGRRCPICRFDLHPAYLAETSGSDGTSPFMSFFMSPAAISTRQ